MTNLYETLGVKHESTFEDIENRFQSQRLYYDPELNPNAEDLSQRKMHFDDLYLAYKTLIDETSRKEYDEYIS